MIKQELAFSYLQSQCEAKLFLLSFSFPSVFLLVSSSFPPLSLLSFSSFALSFTPCLLVPFSIQLNLLGKRRDVLTQLVFVHNQELRGTQGLPLLPLRVSTNNKQNSRNKPNLGRNDDSRSDVSSSSDASWATFASERSDNRPNLAPKVPHFIPRLSL